MGQAKSGQSSSVQQQRRCWENSHPKIYAFLLDLLSLQSYGSCLEMSGPKDSPSETLVSPSAKSHLLESHQPSRYLFPGLCFIPCYQILPLAATN